MVSKEQAEKILREKGHGAEFDKGDVWIEVRTGTKCKHYCGVRSVCRHSPCCISTYREEK